MGSLSLVTHDPNVAAYADRVIRIADGVIEGDERNRPASSAQEVTAMNVADLPPPEQVATVRAAVPASRRHIRLQPGHLPPLICHAATRCGRPSALGVIIAVAAVIAMTEIGRLRHVAEEHRRMGANTLMVFRIYVYGWRQPALVPR
jgi:hypothetical protein